MYSPIAGVTSRPTLPPRVEMELRRACARLQPEKKTSDTDAKAVSEQPSSHHRHALERNNRRSQIYLEIQTSKIKPTSPHIHTHRRHPSEPIPGPASYTHVPTNAATSFENTASQLKSSAGSNPDKLKQETSQSRYRTKSSHVRKQAATHSDSLAQIRAAVDSRPKTSAAACIDYEGPSIDSGSGSTSCTNTTYDPIAYTSTGLTSLAITPGNEKRSLINPNQRVSEQVLGSKPAASRADATAKLWMNKEFARRRSEAESTELARSSSQNLANRPRTSGPDYQLSRAGSISESIRDYIRPRPSSDNVRSSRAGANELSRSASQSSDKNNAGGGWWRGGRLSRKGSWNSLRSGGKGQEKELSNDEKDSAGMNLNRSLPPLPGLDSYKERETKLHISQLVKPGSKEAKFDSSERSRDNDRGGKRGPTIIDEDGLERTLSASEEMARQAELRKAVEEKMRTGVMSPPSERRPTTPGVSPSLMRGQSYGIGASERALAERPTNGKGPHVNVSEVSASVEKKRSGLMKRMSRLLGGGGGKLVSVS